MQRKSIKIISIILAIIMIFSTVPFASAADSSISGTDPTNYKVSNPSFATLSDLHLYTEDLVENGDGDYKKQSDSNTLLGETFPVLNATLETIEKSVKERGLRYIFITGDLTSHCEKLSHIRLAQLLRSFQNKMRKNYDPEFHIFVVPGNHDMNYYNLAKYYNSNGKAVYASSSKENADKLITNSSDFAYIYRELGYGADDICNQNGNQINYYKPELGLATFKASETDPDNPKNKTINFQDAYANLSYSVDLKDSYGQKIKLVAIDGNIYSSDVTNTFITINGVKYPRQETGCTMNNNHLNWITEQSKEGKNNGNVVIGITHFAVTPHYTIHPTIMNEFIYPDWQNMASKLADSGMNYLYSGHLHTSDVSAFTSDNGNTIYDVETPSLGNYSNSYRENSVSKVGEKIKFNTVLRTCDADSQVDMSRVWYNYNQDGTPNYVATKYNKDPNGNPYKKISRPFSENYGIYLYLTQKPLADSNGDTITTDSKGNLIKPDALQFVTNSINGTLNSKVLNEISNAGGCLAYIEKLMGSSLSDLLNQYFGKGDTITLSVITLKKADVIKLAELLCKQIDEAYFGKTQSGSFSKNTAKLVDVVNDLIAKVMNYKVAGYTINEIVTYCQISMCSGTEGKSTKFADVDMNKVFSALNDKNDSQIRGLMDYLVDILLGYTTTDENGKEVSVKGMLIDLLDDINITTEMINTVLPDFAGILRYPALRKLLLGSSTTTPSVVNVADTWAGKILTDTYKFKNFTSGKITPKKVTNTASIAEYFFFDYADEYLTDNQIHMLSKLCVSIASSYSQDALFTDKNELEGTYEFIDNYDLKSKGLVSGYDNAATICYEPLTPKAPSEGFFVAPTSVSVTFGTDSATTKNINWFTKTSVTGTDIQLIPYKNGASADDFVQGNLIGNGVSANKFIKTTLMTYPTIDLGTNMLGENMDMNRHTVELTGLSANTKYSYRIGDASKNIWSEPASLTTASGDNSPFTFLYMTDSQSQSKEQYEAKYGKILANAFGNYSDSKFILHTGDMIDYGANMLQWSWALSQNGIANTTIASTAGNHEPTGTTGKISPAQDTYFDIEHTTQNVTKGVYYDFNYNDAHIIVLNTNNLNKDGTLSADQLQWLTKSVEESNKTWQIVSMHKSIYSNASHYDDSDIIALRKQLSSLMPKLGIDVVLSGHDHVFVRTEFMTNGKITGKFGSDSTASNQSGTVYLINGKSGVKDYKLKTDDAVNKLFDLNNMKTLDVKNKATYSAVKIDGSSLKVETRMLSADGSSSSVVDSFTINKAKLATPTNVTAKSASTTSIKVSWSAVSGSNAYEVYRSTTANGTFSKIATVSGTSYTDTSCKTNTTYYYKVVAGTNKLKSDASAIVSGKATIPAVSNFRATRKTTSSIQTSWSKLASATSYKVYISTSKDSGYKLAGTVTKTNYVVSSLSAGKTYFVKVCAINGAENGEYTSPIAVKM